MTPAVDEPVRTYVDTSVFGGIFDAEFSRATIAFFDAVRERRFGLVVSAVVRREIEPAPSHVRAFFDQWEPRLENVEVTEGALELRRAYVDAGIVEPASAADALHVALATVHRCPVLLSWNCRHIVHYQRIRKYNAINQLHGFTELAIHTPHEVISDV